MNRHDHRAFTLMEAMVTLAIAGIVTAAASTAMSMVMRTISSTRASMTLTSNLQSTVQFLSRDIENAGGQGIPPASALIVEQDTCAAREGMPACGGADRITVTNAIPDLPVCAVRAGSRDDAISFQYVQGGCCFPSSTGTGAVTGSAMLTTTAGLFRPVRIAGVDDAVCEFSVVDVVHKDLYLSSVDHAAHDAADTDDYDAFINGQATIVQTRTYYLDQTAHQLRVRHGSGGSVVDGLVADHIYDLQVALGFDVNNNGVVEVAEWVGRGGLGPSALDPFIAREHTPKEVLISVVQGVPANLKPDTIESPLRPPGAGKVVSAPGVALRAAVAHLSPVNGLFSVGQ